jgi:hypothetical protein
MPFAWEQWHWRATDMHDYEKLTTEDVSDLSSKASLPASFGQVSKKRQSSYAATLLSFVAVISFVAIVISYSVYQQYHVSRQRYIYTPCGNTSEQARSQGCMYEPWLSGWVPPECYYQEVADAYGSPYEDRE